MESSPLDDLIEQQLILADRRGIREPVVALLAADSAPARAIHQQLYGRMPAAETSAGVEDGVVATWPAAAAAQLLREHAGLAGGATANLMRNPPKRPDYWVLWLRAGHLAGAGFAGDDLLFESTGPYGRLEFTLCRECRPHGRGPFLLRVPAGAGRVAAVCGRMREEVTLAAGLVGIAATRTLPAGPGLLPLPVKDRELVLVLRDTYAGAPRSVAEAVRALGKLNDGGARWLLRVLDRTDALRTLGEAVQRELAGE